MACPDENTLLALVGGRLDPERRAFVHAHVDACPACHELLAALALLDPPSVDPLGATIDAPRSVRRAAYERAKGEIVAGRYRLLQWIGEGGAGVVWEGVDTKTGAPVALKFLRYLTPTMKKRFVREARVLTALRHPNIVTVHDLAEEPGGGAAVLVMERLRGESLAGHQRRSPKLPLVEISTIFVPLTLAVQHAHDLGVVHRDLKPANVFLEKTGNLLGGIKLLDFGLAKLLGLGEFTDAGTNLTATGHIVGTIQYMAPEQLAGEAGIDARADVWSLGVILYEALSGQRPYSGRSVLELIRQVARAQVAPVEAIAPDAPRELTHLVARMLVVDREARDVQLAALVAALRGAVEG
jgi:serine/threonine-protein kinase